MMDAYAAAFFLEFLGGHLLFEIVVMAFFSSFVDTGVFFLFDSHGGLILYCIGWIWRLRCFYSGREIWLNILLFPICGYYCDCCV